MNGQPGFRTRMASGEGLGEPCAESRSPVSRTRTCSPSPVILACPSSLWRVHGVDCGARVKLATLIRASPTPSPKCIRWPIPSSPDRSLATRSPVSECPPVAASGRMRTNTLARMSFPVVNIHDGFTFCYYCQFCRCAVFAHGRKKKKTMMTKNNVTIQTQECPRPFLTF